MAKGKASIKITGDSKEAESSIKKVSKDLDSLANKIQKSSFTSLATSFTNIGKATQFVTSTIKKVNERIKETVGLARTQIAVEKQLETAAANNPYLDSNSVQRLKEYAGELQNISNVGDESLLPLMAQLASAGRTQTEIQNIMSAALDLSASGMMSLDTAVMQLNKTFAGSTGQLGNQIQSIKNLTEEELKSGKAVEIIKNQFNGAASAIKDTKTQLENVKGDFKEAVGRLTLPSADRWNEFWKGFYEKGIEVIENLSKKKIKVQVEVPSENGTVKTVTKNIKQIYSDLQEELHEFEVKHPEAVKSAYEEAVEKEIQALTEVYTEAAKAYAQKHGEDVEEAVEQAKQDAVNAVEGTIDAESAFMTKWLLEHANLSEETVEALADYSRTLGKGLTGNEEAFRSSILEINANYKTAQREVQRENEKAAKAAEEAQKKAEELALRNKTAVDLKEKYKESLAAYDAQIAKQIELGEHLEEEEILRGRINVMQQGLFDMIENSNGTVTWNNSELKDDFIPALQQAYEQYYSLTEIQKEEKDALSFLSEEQKKVLENWADDTSIDSLERQKEMLEELKNKYAETYPQIADIIKGAIANIDEAIKESVTETVSEITNIVAESSDKVSEITNGITSLVRQNNEEENEEAQAALAQQYTDGIISYEEYCEKKKQLDKKAAQEEYKLKMWEWTASFLQATANIAQGVAAALTQMPPASYIMAALTAAAGAVQIATITANKPKPPSFATGGIVPGTSYSGDRVQANVNSGEMILNAAQQKNLWNLANRTANNSGAVVNMPVTIENNSSASVSSKLSMDGIRIIVNEIVNSEMQRGSYTESMNIAQTKAQGVSYY